MRRLAGRLGDADAAGGGSGGARAAVRAASEVGDSILLRGDSSVTRAVALARRRRTAEAAAQYSAAATMWSQAAAVREREAAAAPTPVPAPPPVAAAAPAPPPAPAPLADTVRPAPADPAPQIRALFADYGKAIESRSVEAIRRIYPGLSPEQTREWEDFFGGVTDIQVELRVTDLKVAGRCGGGGTRGGLRLRQSEHPPDPARARHVPGLIAARRHPLADRLAPLRSAQKVYSAPNV